MHKKALLAAAVAALAVMTGCTAVRNQAYIDALYESGADEALIKELIAYEKTNTALPDGGYTDVTGKTVEEAAEERGMTLEEYIADNDLPESLPALVSETEANYTVPVSRMAERYGMSLDEFKQSLGMSDDVTGDTTWGNALDTVTVGAYIGESNVAAFVEEYGLPDTVTADTEWVEVRQAVDNVKRDRRIAEESAENTENAEGTANAE